VLGDVLQIANKACDDRDYFAGLLPVVRAVAGTGDQGKAVGYRYAGR
jgi:hypothetical protein